MDEIKFIGVLIIIIILFQIPFLTNHADVYSTLNMILTVVIWLIGTRNISKDTTLKKVMIYGFIILWCGLMVLVSYCIWGKYLKHFSIIDAEWHYSVIIVFIISKILSLKVIRDKINYESKYLISIMIIMLIIGVLIRYGIEYLENYKLYISNNYILDETLYYINISIFSILLFYALKINIENKKFAILSTFFCTIIIFIVNIIPIQKISSIVNSQKELCNIINSNSTTYTYKNISTELGKYLPKGEIVEMENQTWDYQQYAMMNDNYLSMFNFWIQDVNRKNFNSVLESVQDIPNLLNTLIDSEKLDCNYRIISMVVSGLIVSCMGRHLVLGKNEEYAKNFRKKHEF